jgi:hypothetical protein
MMAYEFRGCSYQSEQNFLQAVVAAWLWGDDFNDAGNVYVWLNSVSWDELADEIIGAWFVDVAPIYQPDKEGLKRVFAQIQSEGKTRNGI